MFTGIIENVGTVRQILNQGSNRSFWIESALAEELKVDQSLSHDGVCLTVEEINAPLYKVTAIKETLTKTTLGSLLEGKLVNLERCMPINGRFDGHIVQGHIETVAECLLVKESDGSWVFRFQFSEDYASLVIEKGSICLHGISLTIFEVTANQFSVAIIPYTYTHTNMKMLQPGDQVNIEFDIIGKYVQRMLSLKGQ